MKKILLATTAVVALTTISAEAFAADKIKLSLGGFMRQYVGIASHDEVASTNAGAGRGVNLAQWQNNEIYFNGSTKLDNGLTVAVVNQMETSSAANFANADVVTISVSSDAMGQLTFGNTNHALDGAQVRIPQATGLDWGDGENNNVVGNTATTSSVAWAKASTVGPNDLDPGSKETMIKWISPNFSGVQVSASYTAGQGTQGPIQGVTGNAATDAHTIALSYGGEISGAAVAASIGRGSFAAYDAKSAGLEVGMAGFTVGGAYYDYSDTEAAGTAGAVATTATTNNMDGKAWEIGVGYATGPYTVTLGYAKSESDGDTAVVGSNNDTQWAVGGAYDLGAGVTLVGEYYHAKSTAEAANAATDTASGIIAGIEIGF